MNTATVLLRLYKYLSNEHDRAWADWQSAMQALEPRDEEKKELQGPRDKAEELYGKFEYACGYEQGLIQPLGMLEELLEEEEKSLRGGH